MSKGDEKVTLETLYTVVDKLPDTRKHNKLERQLEYLTWVVVQLAEKQGLSVSKDDYKAYQEDAKKSRPKKPTVALDHYRECMAAIKEEMSQDGAKPTRDEVKAEYDRRKAAGELPDAPEAPEEEAAAPAKSAAKPPKSAGKPAGGKPAGGKPAGAKSGAKPAGKPAKAAAK